MANTAALHHSLGRTQLRRKSAIRLAVLFMVPLFLFTAGIAQPGSWPREWMQDVGLILIVAGILGRGWSTLYIGGRKVQQLVTSGPYSVTRNPLYLFSFIAVVGIGSQTGSIVITLLLLVCAYVIFARVVAIEEAALHEIHGSHFEAYRNAVPRFLPQLHLWKEASELTIDPIRWRRTVLDSLLFLLLVPLIRGVAWLQLSVPSLPVLQII